MFIDGLHLPKEICSPLPLSQSPFQVLHIAVVPHILGHQFTLETVQFPFRFHKQGRNTGETIEGITTDWEGGGGGGKLNDVRRIKPQDYTDRESLLPEATTMNCRI